MKNKGKNIQVPSRVLDPDLLVFPDSDPVPSYVLFPTDKYKAEKMQIYEKKLAFSDV
jgi:hypothetical protein